MLNQKLGRQPVEMPVPDYQQPKSIVYQLDLFEKNLSRLQEVVVQLEGRLGPIMQPLPALDSQLVREQTGSPLSRHLYSLNSTLEGIITNLCVVHDALEFAAEREACAKADEQGSCIACGNRITHPIPQQVEATAQKGGDKVSPTSKSMRTCKYCNNTYTANAFTTRTGFACKWCAAARQALKENT